MVETSSGESPRARFSIGRWSHADLAGTRPGRTMRRSAPMERRRSPRMEIELECTLTRSKGTPIDAVTVDLGPGGMCVRCKRPLAEDELIEFAIPGRRFD